MRHVVYILLLFSLTVQGQVHVNTGTKKIGINGSVIKLRINFGFGNRPGVDDGYYNAFFMPADAYGSESTAGIYKKSFTHGSAGYLMLTKTTDGGRTWAEDSIRVDGSVIHSTNHSFYRYASGRMVISYRTDTSIKFAWNDADDVNFTSSATIVYPSTNYTIIQSPIKMIETSYHTLVFAYYVVGSNGNPASGVLMESLDSGKTFTQKCVMYTHNTFANNLPISDWRGNEIALCETHPTGVESTSKWISIVRTEVANDGGTYPMFFTSSDGANTWTQDTTYDSGSFVNDLGTTVTGNFYHNLQYSFLNSNSPFSIRRLGDSIYVINGERNIPYGYALKYIVATPDSAFANRYTGWTRPRFLKFYNARTLGSSTDCGYPIVFIWNNHLFAGEYDVSTLTPLPSVTRRCFIETVKIK